MFHIRAPRATCRTGAAGWEDARDALATMSPTAESWEGSPPWWSVASTRSASAPTRPGRIVAPRAGGTGVSLLEDEPARLCALWGGDVSCSEDEHSPSPSVLVAGEGGSRKISFSPPPPIISSNIVGIWSVFASTCSAFLSPVLPPSAQGPHPPQYRPSRPQLQPSREGTHPFSCASSLRSRSPPVLTPPPSHAYQIVLTCPLPG